MRSVDSGGAGAGRRAGSNIFQQVGHMSRGYLYLQMGYTSSPSPGTKYGHKKQPPSVAGIT